jgi:hypothetical protein
MARDKRAARDPDESQAQQEEMTVIVPEIQAAVNRCRRDFIRCPRRSPHSVSQITTSLYSVNLNSCRPLRAKSSIPNHPHLAEENAAEAPAGEALVPNNDKAK